jgi:hypothetical protein
MMFVSQISLGAKAWKSRLMMFSGAVVEAKNSALGQAGPTAPVPFTDFSGRRSAWFFPDCSGPADRHQNPILSFHSLS